MKQEYSVPELEVILLQLGNVVTESNSEGDLVEPKPGWW